MAKYPDLKCYLQANCADILKAAIQQFINDSHDGLGFHSINVLSLCKHEIDRLEVKALSCHDDIGPRVKMDVGVAADIVELGLGTARYEANRKRRWFTVYLRGNLINGLTGIEVLDTKEFHSGKFQKESALDQFLVPYIYSADLEDQADDFTLFYCNDAIYNGYALPVADIMRELGIGYHIADLPGNCFGRMYFRNSTATIYTNYPYVGEVKSKDQKVKPGTMLISRQKYFLGQDGTQLLTIAHEIVHWYLHQKYFKLLALLDDETDMMSCEMEPNRYDESMTMAQKAHWYAEWQANALSIRIAMPQALVVKAFHEARAVARPYKYTGELVEDILKRVAALFSVPKFVAKQRARQLDFDVADGAFVYVDGMHCDPFHFTEGILEQRQTFVIDKNGYKELYNSNSDFAALIDSGKFLYLGYVVCINDPKYVVVDTDSRKVELKLSDYAREHADECCLVFSWHSTSHMKDQFEFYGQAYLSKEVNADYYVEHTYDKKFNDKCVQTADQIAEATAAYIAAQDMEKKIRSEMMAKNCDTFASSLKYHMTRKKVKVEELAERSGLSDTTIKKYRSGDIPYPPIENVMAVCIGLNLHKPYCIDLLGTATYQLNDDPRSRAYRFLLDYTDGTLKQWNLILDQFGQAHIPNQRNQRISE